MATVRQDATTERVCEICERSIVEDELMLDLFRKESSVENPPIRIKWVHEICAKEAIQLWLLKRMEQRRENSSS